MPQLGVQIVGDTIGLQAALGESLAATNKWATEMAGQSVRVQEGFAGVSTSALKAGIAGDKLALSMARTEAGTLAAAKATVAYRGQLDALAAAQLRTASSIGRTLTTHITLPVAAVAYESMKAAANFQSSMLLIQTQAGASASEVANLKGQVLALAQSGAQQGPNTLAQGLFHLESVGLRGAQAMAALKVASNAAALGMASLEDVATALGGVLVTGIKGAENYDQAMGTLNATIGAGNMHMQDMVGALGTGVVPAAKNAGITLTELGAALAVMTDRGIGAEQAGTRLRMTFALMQDPSAKAVKALADMGVNANQMATTLRGPNGLLRVLEMLHAAMASAGPVQGSRDILAAFGGGRSGAGILTLIQSLDSATSSFQGKLQQIQKTSGDLAVSEAAQQRTASAQFHQDIASMEADAIKLGGAMLPAFTAVAGGIKDVADAFSALPGPVKRDIEIVVAMLAIGGPLLLAAVGAKKMISTIGDAFVSLPVKAGAAVVATDAELATLGATAATTAGEVAAVGTQLGLLARIGPIAIPITLAIVGEQSLNAFLNHFKKSLPGGNTGPSSQTPATDSQAQQAAKLYAKVSAHFDPSHPHDASYYLDTASGGARINDLFTKYPGAVDYYDQIQGLSTSKSGPAMVSDAASGGTPPPPRSSTDPAGLKAWLAALADANFQAGLSQAMAQINPPATSTSAAAIARMNIPGHESGSYAAGALLAHSLLRIPQNARGSAAATPFSVPLELQLAVAKAGTTGTGIDDLAAARMIKTYDERLLAAHRLSLQGQIDVYNDIARQNSVLGTGLIDSYHAVSAHTLTAGLGLSRSARVALEERLAQSSAHRGMAPSGPSALGQIIHIDHVDVHGVDNIDDLAKQLSAKARVEHQRAGSRR